MGTEEVERMDNVNQMLKNKKLEDSTAIRSILQTDYSNL